jgi:F0F1-type ATP synthase membrane subunit b/b'
MLASLLVAAEAAGEHATNTPNSWLPEWFEIAFGGAASIIIIGALLKFAIPAMKKSMTARSEGIGKELQQAHNNRQNSINLAATIRSDKGDIAAERTRILAEADVTAARVLSEGRARIEVEAAEAETRASADLEAGQGRMTAEVTGNVASLAAAATEHVVKGSLDNATLVGLIEDFIAKVGASK